MSIGSHPPGSVDNDLPEEEKLEPSEVPAPVQAALSKLDEAYEFRAQQVPAVACKFQTSVMGDLEASLKHDVFLKINDHFS